MKNNEVYETMRKVCWEWEDRKKEMEKAKNEAVEEFGWDSKEYKTARDNLKEFEETFPYTRGQMNAHWAMAEMLRKDENELVMSESCFDCSRAEFVDQLRAYGLTEFVCTNHSTALMDDIHGYVEAGCKIIELCEIKRGDVPWEEVVKGIRFAL